MIKRLTKIFDFTAILKYLVETKKSKTEGITQLHPMKISGRTLYIREKEYFVRESYIDGTTPIVFLATSALAAISCIFLTIVSAGSAQLNVDGFFREVGSTP